MTFIIPYTQYITSALAIAIDKMISNGIAVYFIEDYPIGICDIESTKEKTLLQLMKKAIKISLDDMIYTLINSQNKEICLEPQDNRIRYYHYENEDGSGTILFVNEGTKTYEGKVRFSDNRNLYVYDAWNNNVSNMRYDGQTFELLLEPLKSTVIILDSDSLIDSYCVNKELEMYSMVELKIENKWNRSICRSIDYPNFYDSKTISLPDRLAEEKPEFSGFVRYKNTFYVPKGEKHYWLEITDAHEGVEVFVNGVSLGIQIVPVFKFDLSKYVIEGSNNLEIEVATTLERENAKNLNIYGIPQEPSALSGITGVVHIFQEK